MFVKFWQDAMQPWLKMQQNWEKTFNDAYAEYQSRPENLSRVGQFLSTASQLKARHDRMLERALEFWRIPSAADVERLYERMAEANERLALIEDKIDEKIDLLKSLEQSQKKTEENNA